MRPQYDGVDSHQLTWSAKSLLPGATREEVPSFQFSAPLGILSGTSLQLVTGLRDRRLRFRPIGLHPNSYLLPSAVSEGARFVSPGRWWGQPNCAGYNLRRVESTPE
jgi:hypothetical protein